RVLPARRLGGAAQRRGRRGDRAGGGDPPRSGLRRPLSRAGKTRRGPRPRLLPPPGELEGTAQFLQPPLEGQARVGRGGMAPPGPRGRRSRRGPRSRPRPGTGAAMRGRGTRRRDRGSAAVELALLLPIFVLVLFWAVYFTEFSVLRIRQQEASRFLAWETATGLADIGTGRHEARFSSARERALERTRARYANLQGHDLSPGSSTWLAKPRLSGLELRAVGFVDAPTETIGHQVLGKAERSGRDPLLPSLSSLLRGFEGRLDASLRAMGFP